MNYAIVFRLLGYILMIEGTLLLLPAVTSLIYAEWAVMGVFLLTAAISGALGFALQDHQAPQQGVLYAGGLCGHRPELDHHQYHGRSAVRPHRLHPESRGRHV